MGRLLGLCSVLLLSCACQRRIPGNVAGASEGREARRTVEQTTSANADVAEFAGCYELAVRIAEQAASSGEEPANLRVNLLSTPMRTPNRYELELIPPCKHNVGWHVEKGEARFAWSTGFYGIAIRLIERGGDPVALAGSFSDTGPDIHPTWRSVNVKRVPCG
jgi:hypothetical protein